MFALEVARVLAARPDPLPPGAPLLVPATHNELVAQRVSALPPSTRDMLLAAAALSQPTVRLLAELDDQPPATVLAPAVDAELVVLTADRVRFGHPLFAGAVYGDATSERRRALHRRLALLVTEPEERARHLALAADGPSRDVADLLDVAADTARSRFSGIVVFSTNLVANYDRAFESRVRHFRFDLPDAATRLSIWRTLLVPSLPLAADVDVDQLAADTEEFSGREIKLAILTAAERAAVAGQERITQADLTAGINQLTSAKRDLHATGGSATPEETAAIENQLRSQGVLDPAPQAV